MAERPKAALIFLHGWGCAAEDFAAQIEAFGDTRAVIAPNWGARIDPRLDPARAFDLVLDELAAEVPQGAIIAGHSMGSIPASMLAARAELECRQLILLDGGVAPAPEQRHALEQLASRIRPPFEARDRQSLDATLRPPMLQVFETFFPEHDSAPLRARIMQRLEATDSLVLAAQLLAALDCPAAEALRQVEAPVVALVPTSPRLDPAVLRSLQPKASVEQVRDGGHFFFVTRPAETNVLFKRILVDESPTTDGSPIG